MLKNNKQKKHNIRCDFCNRKLIIYDIEDLHDALEAIFDTEGQVLLSCGRKQCDNRHDLPRWYEH